MFKEYCKNVVPSVLASMSWAAFCFIDRLFLSRGNGSVAFSAVSITYPSIVMACLVTLMYNLGVSRFMSPWGLAVTSEVTITSWAFLLCVKELGVKK